MSAFSASPAPHTGAAPAIGRDTPWGRGLERLVQWTEYLSAAVLAADVAVVFISVIYRYFLHDPVDWAEEVASALMVVLVFFGAATVLARSQHVGIDLFRSLLPARWQAAMVHAGHWIIAGVSLSLCVSSCLLLVDSYGQTTPSGLPGWINVYPLVIGSLFMTVFAFVNAVSGSLRIVLGSLAGCAVIALAVVAWNALVPDSPVSPGLLLAVGFFGGLLLGIPIGFVLAFSALLFFLAEPSLPMLVYSQQVMAGTDHFVLLAVPFFVLAGLLMESNGMSSRLIELLLRIFGRVRGGLGLITITATAFFSGVSGSKLADIAAVGGVVMPAVRQTGEDPNEAAALLAASAVMAETIPPCVNMIIMGFVANISIAGLFLAGIVPAAVLAVSLGVVTVAFGRRIDPSRAFSQRRRLLPLLGGALVALIMIGMIGKGVTSGVATSTEVSAFAVVYALVAGWLAFRELTLRSVARLFVRAASMAGGILFIVAAASSVSFALTIEQIPNLLSGVMVSFGSHYGATMFLLLSVLIMIVFGAVLEGAPALIIFGPLLTPIAQQLGINPLHFGTVTVVAMGLGLFAPPVGLGLFATCAITGTQVSQVARPMLKYLLVLGITLVLLVLVPGFSLWLPSRLGM
ncbi:TRAP transporter large permease [Paraburkholderia saeva]|uniref:Sialic acid TRAP transporter permease protein SiaT n=1 Tax=Paraburkholderia saeva TaxID=2777537 RepID=A0A9N8X442_9BURK|nr:TRAP transporter large permease subunit [Paraburkholderia saeva]CAG4894145.1 Sialic acid TRAP transporter permease protein SiaT [Paraburkholderia saeva]CAG4916914.1 Sialic acid TRAP transporter permease protein SiaT [Paraburkholderia saeva]